MSEELGPIDFVLLEFPDQEAPSGNAAAELKALVEAGTIRLYDVVAVRKDQDGNVSQFDLSELSSDEADGFAYFAGAQSGLLAIEDIAEAAAALGNSTVGVALVYENAWAGAFVSAARDSGGGMIATSRIPAQDVLDVLDVLDAN